MIDFSQYNTYTGQSEPPQRRQTNVTGPTTKNQELEFQKQKSQEARYAKNYEAYKKETDLDPNKIDASAIVNATNREIMLEDMNDYNNTQGAMLQQSPDKTLSPEQIRQLKIKEVAMGAKFNQFKKYDTNYNTVHAELDQDKVGDYDPNLVKVEDEKYLKTGRYELEHAPLRDLDPAEVVITKVNKLPDLNDITVGGQKGKAKVNPNTPAGQKEIDTIIAKSMYESPRARNTMVKLFDKLPWEVKMGYLQDENGNKIYDKDEYDNAYIRFAQSDPELRERAIGFEPYKKTEDNKTDKGLVDATLGNVQVKMSPGVQVYGRTYGGKPYPMAYAFGTNPTITGVPTAGGKVLSGRYADNVDPGSVNGKLILYDPLKHVFLIEAVTASASSGTESKALIEVPEESIVGWETIPLKTDTGIIRADFWKKSSVPSRETISKEGSLNEL